MITDESERRISLEGQEDARQRRKQQLQDSSSGKLTTAQDMDDSFSEVPMDEEEQIEFYPDDNKAALGEGTEEIEIESSPIPFYDQTLFCRVFLVCTLYLIAFTAVALIVSGIAIVLAPNNDRLDEGSGRHDKPSSNHHGVSPAPDNLAEVCTVLNLDLPNGFQNCANLCAPAECCWNDYLSEPDLSCTDALEDICPDYMPCKVLEQCMKASCCWKTGAEFADSIYVPSAACRQAFDCENYAICATLNTAGQEQPTTPQQPPATDQDQIFVPTAPDFLATCKAGSVPNSQKLNKCINACLDGSCCWASSVTSCRNDFPTQCAPYDVCSTINENIDNIVGFPATTESPTMAPMTTKPVVVNDNVITDSTEEGADFTTFRNIFEACYNHDDNILIGGVTLCEKECEQASCCVDTELDPFSLWDGALCATVGDNEGGGGFVQCSNYSPCRKLYPELVSPAEVACAEGGDTGDCIKVCADAVCCFTQNTTKSCSELEKRIVCQDYQSCEVLF